MHDIIIKQFSLFNNNINNFIIENKIMVYCNIDLIDNFDENTIISSWIYNENNYRIPKGIKYYKLKNTDNIYDYISSTYLFNINQFISGERIQQQADIIVGDIKSLCWNPNNKFYSKIMSTIMELNDISNYKIIFIFTHDLENFYKKFENQLDNKIIISHNSDHEVSYIKNIKTHFTQNCLLKDSKIFSLPIGIENTQFFNYNILNDVMLMNIKKTKNIYFYFNLNTHKSRITCFNILKDKLEWNTQRDKKEYFIELAKHKYCICPRGNGIDTHRIWECLYLNVIPIIIKSDFINIENLPIIILDDWISFDESKLINEFDNQRLSKLTISYWKKLIKYQDFYIN